MKINIDLNSESVTYADIGATRRRRVRPRRRMGPRRRRPLKRDRYSVLQREVRALRSKIKARLDKVRDRNGSPADLQKARQEARTFFRDWKRASQRLEKMPKPRRRR